MADITSLVQQAAERGVTKQRRIEILNALAKGLWRKPANKDSHALEGVRVRLIRSTVSHLLTEARQDPFRALPVARIIGALRNAQFSFGAPNQPKHTRRRRARAA